MPPFFSHKYRIAYSKIEEVSEINNIKHPTAREVIREFGCGKSLEITYCSDLPSRSGIGSSSAFTVGLISSIYALTKEREIREAELARLAIDIEQNKTGETIGIQDQCASAFGGFVHITANKEGVTPRRFLVRKDYQKYIESSLLIGFTGIQRYSNHASKKVDKYLKYSNHLEKLNELQEISERGIEVFCNEGDLEENAKLTKLCRDIKLSINNDIQNSLLMELLKPLKRQVHYVQE